MHQNNPSQNLDLLRVLFIVKGCFNFLGMFFFLIYAFMGTFLKAFISGFPNAQEQEPFPEQVTWIFVIIGAVGAFICLTFGILTLVAAAKIKARKSYNFIFVVSILNCFTGMLGIALGIFAIVELNKAHVKALFQPATNSKIGF